MDFSVYSELQSEDLSVTEAKQMQNNNMLKVNYIQNFPPKKPNQYGYV